MQEKSKDGILHGHFWEPETVVSEMQSSKSSKGKFLFDINKWLTIN